MNNLKNALVMIVVLAMVGTIGAASAYTAKISELYNTDVYLYNCERFYILNDDNLPHSVTEINGAFDTTILWPGKMTDVEYSCYEGDLEYYDKTNSGNTGVLHIRPNTEPIPKLSAIPNEIQAGQSLVIVGSHYPNVQTQLTITKPDMSIQTLTVTPTNEGRLDIPLSTLRTWPNGIYNIYDEVNAKAVLFSVSGGVTEDEPLVPSPVLTNSTSTNSTDNTPSLPSPQVTDDEDNTPSTPIVTNSTNSKQVVIDFVKAQIKSLEDQLSVWKQLLGLLEAS